MAEYLKRLEVLVGEDRLSFLNDKHVLVCGDGWVFEVLALAQCSLLAVWVFGGEYFECLEVHFVEIDCLRHVVFFVNGFEFGMKSSDNHVLEAVALYFCPVFDLV